MADNNSQGSAVDRRTFLKLVGATAATAGVGGVAAADGENNVGNSENRIIVGIPDSFDLDGFVNRVHNGSVEAIPSVARVVKYNRKLGYVVLTVPNDGPHTQESLLSAAEDADCVKYTEQDDPVYDIPEPFLGMEESVEEDLGQVYTQSAPTDPKFSDQYAPQQVNAPEAWNQTKGSQDVTVAVVDQGAKYDHPDLTAHFGSQKGKDFVDGDSDPMPDNLSKEYHGTHVAGISAATIDNDTGIAGMSNSTLLSCRALSNDGGRPSDIADAVQWAADNGADVINLSLGGGGQNSTMRNAIDYAFDNGALPIAASGNSGKEEVQYPAGYENCMAVTAVDSDESLASFSTTGTHVDVTAPGVDVLSTWTEDGGRSDDISGKYAKISGTSMACPAASGVAALAKAAHPDLDPSTLRQKLKNTATDIGLGDKEQGAGRVDAHKIVGSAQEDNEDPTVDFTLDITDPHVEETVVLKGSADDKYGFIESYEWDFGDGTTATGKNAKHSYTSTGERTITLRVTDDEGATNSTSKTVSVQAGGPGEKQNSESYSGTISQGGGRSEHTYVFQFDPSSLEVTIDTPQDFAWGVVHNDEVYTPGSGSDTVTVQDYNLYPNKQVKLVVVSTERAGNPTGDYSLSLTEYGFGDGGGTNEAPTASLTVSNSTPDINTQVEFDGTGSSDPDGTIETYAWDLGDGTQKNGATITHSYASDGDYTATLTITDDGGKRDQATETIQVSGPSGENPTAAFTLDASTITAGESVEADPSSSSDDGTITEYKWEWGDGSSDTTQSTTTVSHTYSSKGAYDIVLTVTDDQENTASTSRTVTVEKKDDGGNEENVTETSGSLSGYWDSDAYTAATALGSPNTMTFELSGPSSGDFDLYVTTDGREPTTADYDRKSASYDSQESLAITTGVTSSSKYGILVDSYDGSGNYTLTVTENGSGGSEPDPNEGPTAVAAADPTEAKTGDTITLDASASTDADGSISSYEWDLGDGTTKTGATVQHQYDSADTYNARVMVADDDGATDTASVAVTINEPDGGSEEIVTEVTGSLAGYWDDEQWDYTPQTSAPSQITVELVGPAGTDFDLYGAVGYDPDTYYHDAKSEKVGSEESIVLENFSASDELNIMVSAYDGSGTYKLTLTEIGN